jgi:outer membrane receptor protein involved in Fe transport
VLIDGQRFSGKSTDIRTELRRISAASVARIEIVDGATLAVPGLSGQVADIVTVARGLTGNFVWNPQIRARRSPARLTNGEVSISGSLGGTEYSLSLRNDSYRNGHAGPERVIAPDGSILDRRDEVLRDHGEEPRLSGTVRRAFGDGSVLNAAAAFGLDHSDTKEVSRRSGPGLPDRVRILDEREREHNHELGGDYELGLGGGRLKLIGLRRFEHSPSSQTVVQRFADATPATGERFTRTADETETIGRGEYRWRAGGADWQVALEGALNRLEIENRLFTLDAAGDLEPVAFPNAAATVEERRVDAAISYGRPLSPSLSLQASIGGEYSELGQSGPEGLVRTFYRPKGFASLAWRPQPGLDLSARIEREVRQLDFFDFVASADASDGTVNSGNANLVPPQSWNAEIQATRDLGPWGTATARLYGQLIGDIVDIIPIGATGQSPGNIDRATVYGIELTGTVNFDPLGWRGAKLDLNLQFQSSSLEDPLTGRDRPINEDLTREIEIDFRQDIPETDWAYGASFYRSRQSPLFRLDERWQFLDTPGRLELFVEHKDVMGLTMRAEVDNLLGTNESFNRIFFDGRRTGPVRFTEERDRYYGLVFTLTISGTI